MVLNPLNFCLSEKLFISPSVLNDILARYSNLACRFFPFSTLNISCHSLLACRVSAEISAVSRMEFSLYVTCCFSLTAFSVLSLCLVFVRFINMCLGLSPWVYPVWDSLLLLDLTISFTMLEEFSTIISSKFFSYPFFYSFSSETLIIQMLVQLIS